MISVFYVSANARTRIKKRKTQEEWPRPIIRNECITRKTFSEWIRLPLSVAFSTRYALQEFLCFRRICGLIHKVLSNYKVVLPHDRDFWCWIIVQTQFSYENHFLPEFQNAFFTKLIWLFWNVWTNSVFLALKATSGMYKWLETSSNVLDSVSLNVYRYIPIWVTVD